MLSILRSSKRIRSSISLGKYSLRNGPSEVFQTYNLNEKHAFNRYSREFSTRQPALNEPSNSKTSKSKYIYGLGAFGFAAGIAAYYLIPNHIPISLPKPFSFTLDDDKVNDIQQNKQNVISDDASNSETPDSTKSSSSSPPPPPPPSETLSETPTNGFQSEEDIKASQTNHADPNTNEEVTLLNSIQTHEDEETDASSLETSSELQLNLGYEVGKEKEEEKEKEKENLAEESGLSDDQVNSNNNLLESNLINDVLENQVNENAPIQSTSPASNANEINSSLSANLSSKDNVNDNVNDKSDKYDELVEERMEETEGKIDSDASEHSDKDGNENMKKDDNEVDEKEKENQVDTNAKQQELLNSDPSKEEEEEEEEGRERKSEKEKESDFKKTYELMKELLQNPDVMLSFYFFAKQLEVEKENKLNQNFANVLRKIEETYKKEIKELDSEVLKYAQTVNVLEADLEKQSDEFEKKMMKLHRLEEEKKENEIKKMEEKHSFDLEKQKNIFMAEADASVANEKVEILKELLNSSFQIKALEEVFFSKSEKEKRSHEAHMLATATFALHNAVTQGQPLVNEIKTLKNVAQRISGKQNQSLNQNEIKDSSHTDTTIAAETHPHLNDEGSEDRVVSEASLESEPFAAQTDGLGSFLGYVVDSLPNHILERGVLREEQLKEEFEGMCSDLRQLAHLPPHGGGALSHLVAKLASLLKLEENVSVGESGGMDAVICSARTLLSSGNFNEAAQTIETFFVGTAAEKVALVWCEEARNKAIADQALEAIQAYAVSTTSSLS